MAGGVVDIQVRPATKGFTGAVERDVRGGLTKAVRGAVSVIKPVAIAAGTVLAAGIVGGVKGLAQKQGALISLETLLGSKASAQKVFDDIAIMAKKTPFEIPGLTDGAVKLAGVGVAAGDLIPTLTRLGDLTSAVGGSQDDYNGVLRAWTQMVSKGKVSAEEMMQMNERGIPSWQIMARATGKSVAELQNLASKGKLLTDDVLPAFLEQVNKDYGGNMVRQSATLSGIWSNIKDGVRIASMEGLAPFEKDISRVGQYVADKFPALVEAGVRRTAQTIKDIATAGRDIWNGWNGQGGDSLNFWEKVGQTARKSVEVVLTEGRKLATAAKPLWDAFFGAVSSAATTTGGPLRSLGLLFSTFGGVVRALPGAIGPGVQVLASMLDIFARLPGPVQTALLALMAYRALSSRFDFVPRGAREASAQLRDLAAVQRDLAAKSGQSLSTWGAYMGAIESRYPAIGRMAQAFRGAVGDNDRFGASLRTAREQWTSMNQLQGGGFTSMVRSSMTAAGTAVHGFATTAKGVGAAAFSGLKTSAKSFFSVMGGGWGLAFAGLGLVLGLVDAASQKAAQRAAEVKQNARDMAQAITDAGGAGNVGIAQLVANNPKLLELSQRLRSAGTDLKTFMAAAAGDATALKQTVDSIGKMMEKAGKDGDFSKFARYADDLEALKQTQVQLDLLAKAKEEAAKKSATTSQAEKDLSAAIKTLGDDSASSASKVDALRSALDLLNGGAKSQTQAAIEAAKAQQALADTNAKLAEQGGAVAAGAITAAGGINTQTQAGWELYASLDGVSKTYAEQVLAQYASEKATLGQAQAAENAAATMATLRDQFIASATSAGLSADAAAALATELGLVPDNVKVLLAVEGNTAAKEAVQGVLLKIQEAKAAGETSIQMKVDNADAVAALKDLGYKVTELENGEYEISVAADTKPAEAAVDQTVTGIGGKAPTMNIQGNTEPAEASVNETITKFSNLDPNIDVDANTEPAKATATEGANWIGALFPVHKVGSDPGPSKATAATAGAWIGALFPVHKVGSDPGPSKATAAAAGGWISALYPIFTIGANSNPAQRSAGDAATYAGRQRGDITVGADTGSARGTVNSFMAWVAGRSGTVMVGVRTIQQNAIGGINTIAPVKFFRDGGFMDANYARVVPAGSLRVIGDNPNDRESFIPWNDSARSFAIWLATAEAFKGRLASLAAKSRPATSSGPTQVNNVYYPVAERTSTLTRRLALSINRQVTL